LAGLSFSVDVNNDGSYEVLNSLTQIVNITLPNQGNYDLLLRIADKDGATRDYLRAIIALNVAPSATFAISSLAVNEGDGGLFVQFIGVTDPSSVDTTPGFTYSYDLDVDGIFEFANVTATSQLISFPQDGSYTVRGRVYDIDGGFNEFTRPINVANVPPQIVTFIGASSGDEGTGIVFTGSVADVGSDLLAAFAIVRQTNVANDPGVRIPVVLNSDLSFRFEHIFDTDVVGGYDVELLVSDGTDSTAQSLHVSISNIVPTLPRRAMHRWPPVGHSGDNSHSLILVATCGQYEPTSTPAMRTVPRR